MKHHIRSLVLPVAILLALAFHGFCGELYFLVPYLVFTMLFLNYTAVDVRKMHISRIHLILILVQILLSIGLYVIFSLCGASEPITHGILIGTLTPIAASAIVISCALGAGRESMTTFTILDNLVVAVAAPIIFSSVGSSQDLPFVTSFWKIFCRVCPQIVFPFVIAILLQRMLPKVNDFLSQYKWTTLYVWAFTLTLVLGRAFHDVITAPDPDWTLITIQCILSTLLCALLFALGKWLGRRHGEQMAGGQMLGQKNTSFGIWLAIEYLNPLSAIFPAIYSVCQNIFNSWQMYQHDKK